MEVIWNSNDLSLALGVKVPNHIKAFEVHFNSLDIKSGDIFIALKGNNGDGHDYAYNALKAGANVVILSRLVDDIPSDKMILVEDTMSALLKMAEYKRAKSKAKIIAITGSVGKTSTKEMTSVMLQSFGMVFTSRKNFNNHIGVPLNLASMPNDVDYAVFELGMNHAGEILNLSTLVKPDIALITNISAVHLEYFDSVAEIADAKCEIFAGLKTDGIAIVNRDNDYYSRIHQRLAEYQISNIYCFGENNESNIRLLEYNYQNDITKLVYQFNDQLINLSLSALPKHHALNFTAVLVIAQVLGLDIHLAATKLTKFSLLFGRGNIVTATRNNKKYSLICDHYNASPESMKASLQYLAQIDHVHKIAVIGDMLELGELAIELHLGLAPHIINSGVKKVFFIGAHSRYIYEKIKHDLDAMHFDNIEGLLNTIDNFFKGDELILIKGSRSMRLEKLVECFNLKQESSSAV